MLRFLASIEIKFGATIMTSISAREQMPESGQSTTRAGLLDCKLDLGDHGDIVPVIDDAERSRRKKERVRRRRQRRARNAAIRKAKHH